MNFQNKLFYGDNLLVLRQSIKDETVDLCYIDPPFNSKRNYNQIYNNIGKEDAAQAQAFVDTWTWNTIANEGFEEITNNKNGVFTPQSINLILGLQKVLGKSSLLAYLVSMTQRIAEIYRVLKPTGSFYLHCDPTASHYLKLVCDAIFCTRGGDFRNEIVWSYTRWTNVQAQFQSQHDVILFYSKNKKTIFNEQRIALEVNRKRNLVELVNGKKVSKKDKEGKIIYREQTDTPLSDVWNINRVGNTAKERLGYPTQKPEALLERIIKASSKCNQRFERNYGARKSRNGLFADLISDAKFG
ncbi:MAG: site-specific DNA-methyltransferase [Bacteroidetes bacterium]|nr:MAG: site-specific DNA-methyltransferase [Bacteroidota bacterium]